MIKDYLRKKRAHKLRKGYTRRTHEALALGKSSGNPVFLFKIHPVTGESIKDNIIAGGAILTQDGLEIAEDSPVNTKLIDLYFYKDDFDSIGADGEKIPAPGKYSICDIHNFAAVMRIIGRGITIVDNTGGWTP